MKKNSGLFKTLKNNPKWQKKLRENGLEYLNSPWVAGLR